MSSELSLNGHRASFFFVAALIAIVGGFTLVADVRTNARIDELVTSALERDGLIGRIRFDALALESAVNEHIATQDKVNQAAADQKMEEILSDIRTAREEYTRDLPPGETQAWTRFNDTSEALAKQARTAVRYSNRRLEARARRHLERKIKPITEQLDHLADQLSVRNAQDTHKLLRHREALRTRFTQLAAGVSGIAVVLALLVGARVTRLLRKQQTTIAAQLRELARRNRELDAFASRVAHDLVSPLAPLKGYLTLIRRSKSVGDPQASEMLALAESSAGRMSEMVESLLRFCRAGQRGEGAVAEVDTAVTAILLEVGQTAQLQQVALERRLEPGLSVAVPVQLLQSIAQNLLSNAVKYSAGKPGAHVLVRVFQEKGDVALEVTDNGIGMSEEAQGQLFQPFFRAKEARGVAGLGLGMATTKRLVEAHGGTISVRSATGVGTQVVVRFPRVVAQPSAEPVEPVRIAARERVS